MQNQSVKFKADLKVRSYNFALNMVRFLERLPADGITRELTRQLIRSATSIGANVIEAQASSSKKDFTNFFSYALKSANETKFWLGLLRDTNRSPRPVVETLLKEATELSNILGASILTLRGKR